MEIGKVDMGDLKMLLEALKEVVEDNDGDKVVLGKVSKKLLSKYREYKMRSSVLRAQVKCRGEELTAEVEEKIRAEFDDRVNELNALKDALWSEVYNELEIKPDGKYELDAGTGEVTGVEPKKSAKIHVFKREQEDES